MSKSLYSFKHFFSSSPGLQQRCNEHLTKVPPQELSAEVEMIKERPTYGYRFRYSDDDSATRLAASFSIVYEEFAESLQTL